MPQKLVIFLSKQSDAFKTKVRPLLPSSVFPVAFKVKANILTMVPKFLHDSGLHTFTVSRDLISPPTPGTRADVFLRLCSLPMTHIQGFALAVHSNWVLPPQVSAGPPLQLIQFCSNIFFSTDLTCLNCNASQGGTPQATPYFILLHYIYHH